MAQSPELGQLQEVAAYSGGMGVTELCWCRQELQVHQQTESVLLQQLQEQQATELALRNAGEYALHPVHRDGCGGLQSRSGRGRVRVWQTKYARRRR